MEKTALYGKTALLQLFEWYRNNGVSVALQPNPINHLEKLQTLSLKNDCSMASNPPPGSKTVKSILVETNLTAKPPYSYSQQSQCTTLGELKQLMGAFEGCALKQSAMNMVFSDGNPKAKVMLIGEAPGAEEDKQGKPFVGQSGQLLDKILLAVGLNRENIYISNIIPWRPPGNRPPTNQEIALCEPFIWRHIQLIRPSILVLLGGVAAKTILKNTDGIMKLRGIWHNYSLSETETVKIMATFHPAYLMRSPGQKALVWQDFLRVRQMISEILPNYLGDFSQKSAPA